MAPKSTSLVVLSQISIVALHEFGQLRLKDDTPVAIVLINEYFTNIQLGVICFAMMDWFDAI